MGWSWMDELLWLSSFYDHCVYFIRIFVQVPVLDNYSHRYWSTMACNGGFNGHFLATKENGFPVTHKGNLISNLCFRNITSYLGLEPLTPMKRDIITFTCCFKIFLTSCTFLAAISLLAY